LKFFHAVASWFGQFHTILQGGFGNQIYSCGQNFAMAAIIMSQYPVPIPDMITSAANDEVKRLRALHERKFRKQTGWFLAEGRRICHEAVALGWAMHRLAFVAGREDDRQVRTLLSRSCRVKGARLADDRIAVAANQPKR
jgi:hypothetical protein